MLWEENRLWVLQQQQSMHPQMIQVSAEEAQAKAAALAVPVACGTKKPAVTLTSTEATRPKHTTALMHARPVASTKPSV
jgi:hypothetical protein